jgi:hypothetical protein
MWSTLIGWAIGPLFGKVTDLLTNYSERATKRAEAKLEVELATARAEAEIALKRASNDIDWEHKMADASDRSWKDEFVLVLFSIPLIGAFVPGLQDYVAKGFQFLDQNAPDWFVQTWGVIIAATYGMKKVTDIFATWADRRHARKTMLDIKTLSVKDMEPEEVTGLDRVIIPQGRSKKKPSGQ